MSERTRGRLPASVKTARLHTCASAQNKDTSRRAAEPLALSQVNLCRLADPAGCPRPKKRSSAPTIRSEVHSRMNCHPLAPSLGYGPADRQRRRAIPYFSRSLPAARGKVMTAARIAGRPRHEWRAGICPLGPAASSSCSRVQSCRSPPESPTSWVIVLPAAICCYARHRDLVRATIESELRMTKPSAGPQVGRALPRPAASRRLRRIVKFSLLTVSPVIMPVVIITAGAVETPSRINWAPERLRDVRLPDEARPTNGAALDAAA